MRSCKALPCGAGHAPAWSRAGFCLWLPTPWGSLGFGWVCKSPAPKPGVRRGGYAPPDLKNAFYLKKKKKIGNENGEKPPFLLE